MTQSLAGVPRLKVSLGEAHCAGSGARTDRRSAVARPNKAQRKVEGGQRSLRSSAGEPRTCVRCRLLPTRPPALQRVPSQATVRSRAVSVRPRRVERAPMHPCRLHRPKFPKALRSAADREGATEGNRQRARLLGQAGFHAGGARRGYGSEGGVRTQGRVTHSVRRFAD